ncbi:hypothetical protein CCR75_003697 [Bremia lactucae]|uniref:Arf-GAP with coiled-coil, ANK repeat and PH domain-containing protein n=1 Tax=Bremia lactucae TaxID=4779 RepID=A0A976NZ16_BRELC|nr:hypothetical protein CCR75_003697 [Bremia lactucae]
MKAFNAWRDGKVTVDAISELQMVIQKKDLMILSLQTQLEAYVMQFGALPVDKVDQVAQMNAINEPQEKRNREWSVENKTTATDENAKVLRNSSDNLVLQQAKRSHLVSTLPRIRANSDVDETRNYSRFSKNVVLDYVEDSPMFRRQIESFEESITGLRALLKEIVAHSKEYTAAGKYFGEQETALAHELIQRKYARAIFSTSCPELGSVSELFKEMSDTLVQIQSSRVSMLLRIESFVSQSMSQFAEKELLKEASELKKDVARLGDEYETLLGKLLSKSRQIGPLGSQGSTPTNGFDTCINSPAQRSTSLNCNGESTLSTIPLSSSSHTSFGLDPGGGSQKHHRTLEREVVVARRRFELARFDLVRYFNRIDGMKKHVLVECCNSILYAQSSHFHACHDVLKAIESKFWKHQELLQVSRQNLAQDELMWTSQREHLNTCLLHDIELVCSHELNEVSLGTARSPSMETSIQLDAFPSLNLPVEVISTDTLNSRQTVAMAYPSVTKQGFLFVRNAMFPARSWKRRWFQIQAGKLFQRTYRSSLSKHSMESNLTLVCDLLLARVRQVEHFTLPFCFEVIDTNRTKLLLQAVSACDMADWMDVARRSTASALEKQSHRETVHPDQQHVIDELIQANSCCADCGQEPAEWVSINIGCLLCIECSGIHRSLGVHESKVRSLALDSWDMPLLFLLRDELGNDKVNAVWEHTLGLKDTKPTPLTQREEKARFIKAKYHFRKFVEPLQNLDENDHVFQVQLLERFFAGAACGVVTELMWCVAHGVDVNERVGEEETTALCMCAASGMTMCCHYLVQNGASLTLTDTCDWKDEEFVMNNVKLM